jgi:hypothetical protein
MLAHLFQDEVTQAGLHLRAKFDWRRSAQMSHLRFGRDHDEGGSVGLPRGGELMGESFGGVRGDRPAAEACCDGGDVEAG